MIIPCVPDVANKITMMLINYYYDSVSINYYYDSASW